MNHMRSLSDPISESLENMEIILFLFYIHLNLQINVSLYIRSLFDPISESLETMENIIVFI